MTWHDGIIFTQRLPSTLHAELVRQTCKYIFKLLIFALWMSGYRLRYSDWATPWSIEESVVGSRLDMRYFYTPNSPLSPILNGYRSIFLGTTWPRCGADNPHHLASWLRVSGPIPPPPRLSSLRAQVDLIALFCINSVTYTLGASNRNEYQEYFLGVKAAGV